MHQLKGPPILPKDHFKAGACISLCYILSLLAHHPSYVRPCSIEGLVSKLLMRCSVSRCHCSHSSRSGSKREDLKPAARALNGANIVLHLLQGIPSVPTMVRMFLLRMRSNDNLNGNRTHNRSYI